MPSLCFLLSYRFVLQPFSDSTQTTAQSRRLPCLLHLCAQCRRAADMYIIGVVGPVVSDLSGPRQPTHGLRQKILLHLCAVCGGVPLWVLKQAGVVLAGLAWLEPGLCCPCRRGQCAQPCGARSALWLTGTGTAQLSQLPKASHSVCFALVLSASSGQQPAVCRQQDVLSQ